MASDVPNDSDIPFPNVLNKLSVNLENQNKVDTFNDGLNSLREIVLLLARGDTADIDDDIDLSDGTNTMDLSSSDDATANSNTNSTTNSKTNTHNQDQDDADSSTRTLPQRPSDFNDDEDPLIRRCNRLSNRLEKIGNMRIPVRVRVNYEHKINI